MGNAPVGFLKSNETEKIYFFKAQVAETLDSEIFNKESNDKYIWVKKDELKDFIKSEKYLNAINKFIIDF